MTEHPHAELKRLAEAATPGPWEASSTVVWREEAVPVPVTMCCGHGLPSGECCGNDVEDCEWERTQAEIANAGSNDAAFIAAANPQAILSLIEENERLREALKATVGAIEATDHRHRSNLEERALKVARQALETPCTVI